VYSAGILEQSMRARNRGGMGLSVVVCLHGAGILEQSMKARNRVGMGLSYWPAMLHRLAELIPRNRRLGSLNVNKFGLR
jgi:hypothetical protein